MPRKLFVSSKFTEFDEYVTIGTGGIYFSAEFVKKNNLEDVTFAKFYTFDEILISLVLSLREVMKK